MRTYNKLVTKSILEKTRKSDYVWTQPKFFEEDLSPARCFERFFSEKFIEHAPNIENGRDALLSLFASRYKKYPELSMSIKRTASEGDLVWLHLHVKHTPDSLGGAGIHIFRMKEGKIVEHWGVGQPVPKESKNNNTMF